MTSANLVDFLIRGEMNKIPSTLKGKANELDSVFRLKMIETENFTDALSQTLIYFGVEKMVNVDQKKEIHNEDVLQMAVVRYTIEDAAWNSQKTPVILWILRGAIFQIMTRETSQVAKIIVPMVKFLEPCQTGRNARGLLNGWLGKGDFFIAEKYDGTLIIRWRDLLGNLRVSTQGSIDAAGPCGESTFGDIAQNLLGSEELPDEKVFFYELMHSDHPTNPMSEPKLAFLGGKDELSIALDGISTRKGIETAERINTDLSDLLVEKNTWSEGDTLYIKLNGQYLPILKLKQEKWELLHYIMKGLPLCVQHVHKLLCLKLNTLFPAEIISFMEAMTDNEKLFLQNLPPRQIVPLIPGSLTAMEKIYRNLQVKKTLQLDWDDTMWRTGSIAVSSRAWAASFSGWQIIVCSGRSALVKEEAPMNTSVLGDLLLALYPGSKELREKNLSYASAASWKSAVAQIVAMRIKKMDFIAVDDNLPTLRLLFERVNGIGLLQSVPSQLSNKDKHMSNLTWIHPMLYPSSKQDARKANTRSSINREEKSNEKTLEKARKIADNFGTSKKTIVFMWGPPGVGKTTFITALSNVLHKKGITMGCASADAVIEDSEGQLDQAVNMQHAENARIVEAKKLLTDVTTNVVVYDSVDPNPKKALNRMKLKCEDYIVVCLDFVSGIVGNMKYLTQLWRSRVSDFNGNAIGWLKLMRSTQNSVKSFDKAIVIEPWMEGVEPTSTEKFLLSAPDGVIQALPPKMTVIRPYLAGIFNGPDLNSSHVTTSWYNTKMEGQARFYPDTIGKLFGRHDVAKSDVVTISVTHTFRGKQQTGQSSFDLMYGGIVDSITGHKTDNTTTSEKAPAKVITPFLESVHQKNDGRGEALRELIGGDPTEISVGHQKFEISVVSVEKSSGTFQGNFRVFFKEFARGTVTRTFSVDNKRDFAVYARECYT